MRDALDLVAGGGPPLRVVRLSGGGARSRVWRQIIADVLGAPVVTLAVSEGAAFGAAILATVGAELHADIASTCAACVRTTEETHPGPDRPAYAAAYPVYRELYPALASSFAQMR